MPELLGILTDTTILMILAWLLTANTAGVRVAHILAWLLTANTAGVRVAHIFVVAKHLGLHLIANNTYSDLGSMGKKLWIFVSVPEMYNLTSATSWSVLCVSECMGDNNGTQNSDLNANECGWFVCHKHEWKYDYKNIKNVNAVDQRMNIYADANTRYSKFSFINVVIAILNTSHLTTMFRIAILIVTTCCL